MNQGERGQENLRNIKDRGDDAGKENRADRTGGPPNGEAAGGDQRDVPGGAYNVPTDMADDVSDEPAHDTQRPKP